MEDELTIRRRALGVVYRRYVEADLSWHAALEEMLGWFPRASRPNRVAIGDPGSRIRRLWERRERALIQLEASRAKLAEARGRQAARRAAAGRTLLLIGVTRG